MSEDLSPLADRLGMLQILRLGIVAAVLLAAAFAPGAVGLHVANVAPLTGAYAFVTAAAEVARRLARARWLSVVTATLLLDGLYLAAVTAPVGGPTNGLICLVYAHVVAVTLLASYRTGVKLALWHSLLMIVGYWVAHSPGVLDLLHLDNAVVAAPQLITLGAVGLLLLSLATAAAARVSEQELRRGKAELAALVDMGTELEEARTPEEVNAVLVRHVQTGFGFAQAAVVGPEAAGDQLVREAVAQHHARLARRIDESTSPYLAAALPGARNVIVVPMVADRQLLGAFAVERGGLLGSVARSTVNAVTSFVTHAALALRNAALLAEVERLATIDGLTGVANRRSFEAALHREVVRAGRSGQPLSLIVIDLDHFKAINDGAGHQGGDEVLRHVGAALASHAREIDLTARYGGEEFCVLLPACPPDDAMAVAERLRAAIAEYDGPIRVTASAGVATLPLDAGNEDNLVAAADKALYRAKANGRDQAVAAGSTRLAV